MNNIKVSLFLALFLSLFTQSFSQSFTIKGGMNLTNMLVHDDDIIFNNDNKLNPGFLFCFTTELALLKKMSLETGLLLNSKGLKLKSEVDDILLISEYNPIYLDIPLTIKTKYILEKVIFFGNIGSYVGFGISGKEELTTTVMGNTSMEIIEAFGSVHPDRNELKRLDAGLLAGFGLELGSIQFELFYQYGLANISAFTEGRSTIQNRVLSFALGYKL